MAHPNLLGTTPLDPAIRPALGGRWPGWLRRAVPTADRPARPAAPVVPAELRANSRLLTACRALRFNIAAGQIDRPLPSLLVIDTTAGDGGLMVAAGLAAAQAAEAWTTLVVEVDGHRPRLRQLFQLPAADGLTEAIRDGTLPVTQRITDHLWVLPAGEAVSDPIAALRQAGGARWVAELTARFDSVIYATPGWPDPAAALTLAHQVGTAILAIQMGTDALDDLGRLKESLERSGVQLPGFVLVNAERG